MDMNNHRNKILLILISLLVFAWVVALANAKLKSGGYNALDLGIYTQVAWNSSHGNVFGFSIHPHSYLGDHLEFLYLIVVPFFYVFPSPLTLIILQALAICLGGIILYHFAKKFLNQNFSVFWAIIFLINPFTLNALTFEFHALLFAVPLIFLMALAYVNKNFKLYCLWMLLILLVREDLSLIVAGFALLALLEKRPFKWWLTPGLISIAWFLGATYITGQINGEGYKFINYFNPAGTGPEIKKSILSDLLKIFRPQNLIVLLSLILPVLAFPLLKWRWLALMILPFLGISIASYGAGDVILETHYVIFFLPGIFLAAILGWQKFWTKPPKFILNLENHAQPLVVIILAAISVYSLLTFGPTLGAIKTWKKMPLTENAKAVFVNNFAKNTPKSESVIAGYNTLVPFADRPQVYAFHYAFLGKRQYSTKAYPLPTNLDVLAFDSAEIITLQLQYAEREDRKEEYQGGYQRIQNIIKANRLKLSSVEDTQLIFSKTGNLGFQLLSIEKTQVKPGNNPINISVPGQIKFTNNKYVEVAITARINKLTDKNYQVELAWLDSQNKILETRYLPLGYGLNPTSNWKTDELVTTNFRLIPPENALHAKIRAIIPKGSLVLNGWRSAEVVMDKNLKNQSEELVFILTSEN
ncbi:MAG: DUF2079 domain-containing protein [Patescibacteria group bacterium]